ncbi:MAG: transcription elongation factor GreA, partial [Chitinivibrionales bacterium]|nr:transcription elongation factor GreA [Chitinivibrionales bacterium]MBD3358309.1 transcription elongation factor GreA [Chitinivibrionales bacterium]
MSSERVPITQNGYNELLEELEKLKKVERPNVIKRVAEARSHGDLSENAEYHAAREEQSHIQSRINFLEDRIARSDIITIDTANSETIIFGCTV